MKQAQSTISFIYASVLTLSGVGPEGVLTRIREGSRELEEFVRCLEP